MVKSESRKIGIFGGTFNPIHNGHLIAAEQIKEIFDLDKILFIPSFSPPHKEDVIDAKLRYEMVLLATASNEDFVVSDLEIKRGGKSYSIDTIKEVKEIFGENIYFILGIDAFLDIPSWKNWKELIFSCNFIVILRPNYFFENIENFLRKIIENVEIKRANEIKFIKTGKFYIYFVKIPTLDISSTKIREKIKNKESIRYLVPEAVYLYIKKNKLYL